MGMSAGVTCHKDGFGCTVVSDDGSAVDHDIEAPASMGSRGEVLAWLAEEAERLIAASGVIVVGVQKAAGGGKFAASPERNEVEAAVQIGVHRAGAACSLMNREQVRAALGVSKGKGAYDTLLQRDDVAARSNANRRDQYLLALAARA